MIDRTPEEQSFDPEYRTQDEANAACQRIAKAIADRVHGAELARLRKMADAQGERGWAMLDLFDAAVKAGIADETMRPSDMGRGVGRQLHPALAVRYLIELRAAILADLANIPMREGLREVFDTVSRFLDLPQRKDLP